ncbi:MAG: hypothetical protein EBU90_14670 [Proteobacteria bacterium]|nr:hypothetical protein [Pseudomonadota bacterium]NBP15475.1 hypothetical protein [bacterium]
MESGFGQNLEGFLIKGNLSVIPSDLPLWQGDGSLEGSGTLYFDKIQEYNVGNGIDIAGIILRDNTVYVPYNKPGLNATSASFVIDGGIGVNHTANATCLTSGGGLTVRGGASFGKNVHIGGTLDVNANRIVNVNTPVDGKDAVNKDYVDLVAGNVSGNFTTGQIIIAETDGTRIRGYDSFTFDGSKLSISTPVVISNTGISTGLSSGGLVVYGGASIGGDSTLGGNLNLSGHNITNLAAPVNAGDAATKQYVDDNKLQGNFTTGQLIIAASDGRDIRGFPELTFNGSILTLFSTTNVTGSVGGAFVCYGGISISKDVFIGGRLDVNGNKIVNVDTPVQPSDVANKAYVDSRTFGTLLGSFGDKQVIIGTTDPNSLTGYNNFLYDGTQLSLGTAGSLVIYNTKNSTSLTGESSLVVYGGGNLRGDLFVGGHINAGGNTINKVAEPVLPDDAATKKYVDDRKLQGNFTTGQLIIGDSNGDAIRGRDNLIFDYNAGNSTGTLILDGLTDVSIKNTTNATGLGTGGTLTSLGGASFNKDVYIGGKLDVNIQNIKNVATPIDSYDAVNKAYVDAVLSNLSNSTSGNLNDSLYENTFVLSNNVLSPQDIPLFTFGTDIKAFISYIYVQYNFNECALYTIRGLNRGNSWYISPSYVGEPTDIKFWIRSENGQGIMQYTNRNVSGTSSIKFRTITQIEDLATPLQINYTLAQTSVPIDIPSLSFLNQDIDSNKIIVYVSSQTNNQYGMFFLNCVLKGSDWVMNSYSIGNVLGVKFRLLSQNNLGKIQYCNTNATGDYIIRVKQIKILKTQTDLTLNANTLVPTNVGTGQFSFGSNQTNFQITVFVSVPALNKHALYELEGMFCDDVWKLNARFIGDRTGIEFSLSTTTGNGYLKYINPNGVNATIRYIKNTPLIFQPLPVNKGGTGNTFLGPYTVLRGNGSDPVIGTNDFIYKNYQLILGDLSSIILTNTSPAVNLTTGGTLTTYGGISIGKNLLVGDALTVKSIDITPSVGDLTAERGFYAHNNQTIPENITGYAFTDPTIKSFTGVACVTITTNGNEYDSLYELKGLKKSSGWILNATYIGDNLGMRFSITPGGQVQYTSENTPDWVETKIKFRAMTTTV